MRGSLARLADDPRIVGSGLDQPRSDKFNTEAPVVAVIVQEGALPGEAHDAALRSPNGYLEGA